ncbi:MAG: hypothetical protein JXL97_05505, partial [Bacteroidales bacterium]|nr:hypothetical protein [Bacteroidales bacterium]
MAMKLNDFLLAYYKQLHFNSMPVEVRASFIAAEKNNQLTKEMLVWANGKDEDPITGAPKISPLVPEDRKSWSQTIVNNNLPSAETELSQSDWGKLFQIFQSTMRAMNANKKVFTEKDKVNAFMSEYFGDGKIFNVGNLDEKSISAAEKMSKFLSENDNEMGYKIFNILAAADNKTFETKSDFNQFLKDLKDGKYKTDVKIRNKLERLSQIISGNWDLFESKGVNFSTGSAFTIDDASQIANNLTEDENVNSYKIRQFKRDYNDILNTLYKTSDVLEVFSQYDNEKISGPLKKAREKVNYDVPESDNYLAPKHTDKLTISQNISKWFGETYKDCLEKYTSLRGDRMFVSNDANLIIKALDKAKIKTTDGLDKVLSESENIKKNLTPVTRKNFEYFTKIMGELKATMPKAFAGAMSNGRQLRALVSEMIISAVSNGKVEEAKVAMEVLSVIKYGYTTSKIMDVLRNENFTLFSDQNLSWNKGNDAIKFVTTALDKTVKTAFLGIGYGITITKNTIQRSRSSFNGNVKPVEKAQEKWSSLHSDKLLSLEERKNQTIEDKKRRKSLLRKLNKRYDINSRNINKKQKDLDNLNKDIEDIKKELDEVTEYINITNNEITNLEEYIENIKDSQAFIAMTDEEKTDIISKNNSELKNLHNDLSSLVEGKKKLEGSYNNLIDEAKIKRKPIDYFNSAKASVAEMDEQIKRYDEATTKWNDKDKNMYHELMAHWDFLESGKT